MREYIANVLLAATSLALFSLFGLILVNGSHYIQEPNIIILIMEMAGVATILGFALYNLVHFVRRARKNWGVPRWNKVAQ